MRRSSLIALVLVGAAASSGAQMSSTAYERGVDARRSGDLETAADLLAVAVSEEPASADARVQYGYVLLAMDRLAEADKQFASALELAPMYDDATVGRALVAERLGRPHRARTLLIPVSPDHVEAGALRARLDTSRSPVWTIGMDFQATRVASGQSDWRQTDVEVRRKSFDGGHAVGRLEVAQRFGRSDVYGEVRIERPIGEKLQWYALLGLTAGADFRPTWQLGAGARFAIIDRRPPTVATLDVRHAKYTSGKVSLINPGIEQYLPGGEAWITLRSINLIERGKISSGWLGRMDVPFGQRFRIFAGGANAPDTDQGVVTRTRSFFGGASIMIGSGSSVRMSVSRDLPRTGANRTSLSAGLSVPF